MLGPTYLAFIRYFYCACLTRPPDFLSRFRNLAGATQRIEVHPEIESHVAPAEEAGNTTEFDRDQPSNGGVTGYGWILPPPRVWQISKSQGLIGLKGMLGLGKKTLHFPITFLFMKF